MRHKTLTWLHANLLFFGLAFASVGLVSGCGDGGGGADSSGGFSEDAKKKAMEDLEADRKGMEASGEYDKKSKK